MKNKIIYIILIAFFGFVTCKKEKEAVEDAKGNYGYTPSSKTAQNGIKYGGTQTYGFLPESHDLTSKFPSPQNQGTQFSCVGFALAYIKAYQENLELGNNSFVNGNDFSKIGSPAYIYNQLQNSTNCNQGIYLVSSGGKTGALNFLKDDGVCFWKDMPYEESNCKNQPNASQNLLAKKNKIKSFEQIASDNIDAIKANLYSGIPVLVGMNLDANFVKGEKDGGIFIWKQSSEKKIPNGGHACVIIGYDNAKNAFKIINSWGTKWGNSGFAWIDYKQYIKMSVEVYTTDDVDNSDQGGGGGGKTPNAKIQLSGSFNFGEIGVGSTVSKTLTIVNTGTTVLNIGNIEITPSQFHGYFKGNIAPGEKREIQISFTPDEKKIFNGQLKVNSNSKAGINIISLSGKGKEGTASKGTLTITAHQNTWPFYFHIRKKSESKFDNNNYEISLKKGQSKSFYELDAGVYYYEAAYYKEPLKKNNAYSQNFGNRYESGQIKIVEGKTEKLEIQLK